MHSQFFQETVQNMNQMQSPLHSERSMFLTHNYSPSPCQDEAKIRMFLESCVLTVSPYRTSLWDCERGVHRWWQGQVRPWGVLGWDGGENVEA